VTLVYLGLSAKITLRLQAKCYGNNPVLEEALQGLYKMELKEAIQKEKHQLQNMKYTKYLIKYLTEKKL
jgi:hypothetical protein